MEKLVASMAANDAFRDAIVLVRVYEDERSAGTVATGVVQRSVVTRGTRARSRAGSLTRGMHARWRVDH
jgi:hypothetical protein